ncbi:MAG: DUF59 domain-containing protein [Proteobacteria bacterium]|nr:DUF59 domain-containing protein [Pseudomonadota bacterium]
MGNNITVHEQAIDILKTIFDPEIPVNVVDLGLIYSMVIKDKKLLVQMTLTNPACPVANQFPHAVKTALETIKDIDEVTVELVWDPPWTPERMTEAAKLTLGML